MARRSRYSPEVKAHAVRMVLDQQHQHESQWAAIVSVASKIGCTSETLRKWVRQSERDTGKRVGLTTDERTRLKALERDPTQGIGVFRPGGARPPTECDGVVRR